MRTAPLQRLRPLGIPLATAFLLGVAWWWEARVPPTGGSDLPRAWSTAALYGAAFAVGGWQSALSGLRSLRRGRIDVEFLMVAAALGAFSIGQPKDGAILIFIFALSNALEQIAMSHTRRAIQSLIELKPAQARRLVRREGPGSLDPDELAGQERALETVPVETLEVGDVVQVLPGERLPTDGAVVHGRSAVDPSAITGESLPQEKGPGDPVLGGSVNLDGLLWVQVTRPAVDSTLARIIQLVEQAEGRKAPTQLFIERFEQLYSTAVVVVTLGFIAVPSLVLGWDFRESLYRAMTIMVVASPCAVVLSTMPAMLSAVAAGARRGVLFKGALYLEQLANVRVMAFDKTGTLTTGQPEVTGVVPAAGWAAEQALALAAGVESGSEHPLARAVVREAHRKSIPVEAASEAREHPGRGVEGTVGPHRVRVGSPAWFRELGQPLPPELVEASAAVEAQGRTVMVVGVDGAGPVAVIGVADQVRPQARAAIEALKGLGIERAVILTGDNERVAAAVAARLGVDEPFAGLLPEQKLDVLRELERRYGPVAMVGDGINDAPALAAAAVGIAMGRAGTDVAMETADVVLMSDDLTRLEGAVALGRRAEQVVRQNLAFAFGVITVLLALAASGHLSLTQGVIGHETSTVLVALNGLRLLGFRWPAGQQVAEQAGQVEMARQAG